MQAPPNHSGRRLDDGHDCTPQNESDSDWEYEYDDTQTEDFYVTLDLSSNIPLPGRKRKALSSPPLSTTPKEPLDPTISATNSQPASDQNTQEQAPAAQDNLQILDLHTPNPIISYQGNLYTCHWASALGTDLLFSVPPNQSSPQPSAPSPHAVDSSTTTDTPNPTTANTSDYTLHAATTIRLIGKPTSVIPRPSPSPSASSPWQPPLLPPVDHRTSAYLEPHRRAQTAFLTRLAATKRAKGDTDAVPVYTNQPNHQPAATSLVFGRPRGPGPGRPRGRGRGRGRPRMRPEPAPRIPDEDGGGAEGEGGTLAKRNQQRRERRWDRRTEEALGPEEGDESDESDGNDDEEEDEAGTALVDNLVQDSAGDAAGGGGGGDDAAASYDGAWAASFGSASASDPR